MLTKKERRFIRYWEEQRSGSRAGYYVLYILIWFFVSLIFLFFLLNNFTRIQRNQPKYLYIILAASTSIAAFATHGNYRLNERRFKKIIRREVDGATAETGPANQV